MATLPSGSGATATLPAGWGKAEDRAAPPPLRAIVPSRSVTARIRTTPIHPNTLRQASLSRVTKQLMPTPQGRRPAPPLLRGWGGE